MKENGSRLLDDKNINEIVIYEDKNGITKINVKFMEDDVWLTQNQIADIYQTTQENISMHINNLYKDKELSSIPTNKKFLLVQKEGARNVKRNIDHYNLDMIIALGYRVQSDIAVRFRIWATTRLHEYIQKGFTMYDERLKQGGNRYFKELLQRLNLLVSQFLDFAELQALEQRKMRMLGWVQELDNEILHNRKNNCKKTINTSKQCFN